MSLKLSILSTQSNDLKHKALGFIADNITNIFTIFSFAAKRAELKKIRDFTCGEVADLDYKKNFAITNYKYWDRSASEISISSDEGGDILINNQSIYDVSSDSLRAQISLIPQDIMLFHRSIFENIAYAKQNATIDEVIHAAIAANIHEFITTLPEGYDTMVGERGVKLSGGQRQRIAIARAILKNAPILILDKVTSSIDSQAEQEIQKSINSTLDIHNATVIAIAHRLSTIKHMDRIIVIEDENIVEDGSFQELIAKDHGKFKEMWDSQVNGMLA